MITITTKVSGFINVSEDTTFHHISAASVTVEANVVARLYGDISQILRVKVNATVYLHGRCKGRIINEGGTIYQFLSSGEVINHSRAISLKKA